MPTEHFSLKLHKRHRKALARRLDHLQTRIAGVDRENASYDIAEAAALAAALVLMDDAIAAETTKREQDRLPMEFPTDETGAYLGENGRAQRGHR